MHNKFITAAAAIFLATASANAAESLLSDREVHGRTVLDLTSTLHSRGIDAEHVEAWGDSIRVDAIKDNGERYVVMLEKDTLRPVSNSPKRSAVEHTSPVAGFKWSPLPAATAESLVGQEQEN
ncbi:MULTISPECIES: hypothetical protein [unclassified Devosia]|uniref:hypothetical protein n=1 Tax=unclassified Devosia TaxID=196773 RepID=UPI000FD92842|nr:MULTISPECIES: hypothetical protein [unclassified Devosia]